MPSITTRYEHDKLGRRTKRILPLGQSETYSYDTVGNLISHRDFKAKTTTFSYDVMNRLLVHTPDASFNQAGISYSYTVTGQRATMSDISGITRYGYDVRDRLISVETPHGTLSYTYNAIGNILTLRSSNPNGVSLDYNYDALNRVVSVTDNRTGITQPVTSYGYDNVGNLTDVTLPNGVT
jgi:YD repeat-containing protein